jgi:L-lactate dehydrogenase complex protein LldG
MNDEADILTRVRRALGHGRESVVPPAPPEIPDSIARLVPATARIDEVFIQRAAEQKMIVTPVSRADFPAAVADFVRQHPIRRVALSSAPLLDGVAEALRTSFEVRRWNDMSLDELYEFDCGVTEVQYAVAEIGGMLIKPSASHGRGLSLVPMFHVAVVERSQIVPDLIDLLERIADDPDRSNHILVAGPSKTADIEMNVVTGVHGPNVVRVFLLP